ncbi:MAG: hypothetical protein HOP36_08655 [Methyloglobulus sp.]|nr:hypothetical protein [Methyloglobulus sp.]
MIIYLFSSDVNFLIKNFEGYSFIQHFKKAQGVGEFVVKDSYRTGKYQIDLTFNEMEKVKEALGTLLLEKGVGNNSEINAVGYKIENLIDQFNNE